MPMFAHLEISGNEDLVLNIWSHLRPILLQTTFPTSFTRNVFPSQHRFNWHCSFISKKCKHAEKGEGKEGPTKPTSPTPFSHGLSLLGFVPVAPQGHSVCSGRWCPPCDPILGVPAPPFPSPGWQEARSSPGQSGGPAGSRRRSRHWAGSG